MAQQFVRVRLVRITGYDLNWLEFDMDLTWAALFVHPDGHIYGRFGGRDAKDADSRNSLAGLRYAMEAALTEHRAGTAKPAATNKPLYIEKVPAYAGHSKRGCIHCHQAKEILREQAVRDGGWDASSRWVFPLPENIGITLERDRGDKVQAVAPSSAAAKAGLRAGDVILGLNGRTVHSFADAQYALHKAPAKGTIAIAWHRDNADFVGQLQLAEGWKKTNLTWRPSLMDMLPSLPLFGTDLTSKEKTSLGLKETRLAFRQDSPVPPSAKKLGVQEGDIILGVDGLEMNATVEEFLAYVRRNYLHGDRVTLNLVRGGKKVDVAIRLP